MKKQSFWYSLALVVVNLLLARGVFFTSAMMALTYKSVAQEHPEVFPSLTRWAMHSNTGAFLIVLAATVATALALSKPSPGIVLMRCTMVLLMAEGALLVLTLLAFALPAFAGS